MQLLEPQLPAVRTMTPRCHLLQLKMWCDNGPPPGTGTSHELQCTCHCHGPHTAVKLLSQCYRAHLVKIGMSGHQVPAELYPPTGFLVVTTFLTLWSSSLFPTFLFSSLLSSLTANKSELLFWSPSFDLFCHFIPTPGIFEFPHLHLRVVDGLGHTPRLRHMRSKRTKKKEKNCKWMPLYWELPL